MKRAISLTAFVLAATTSIGWAHSPVKTTSPSHNAVLTEVPTSLVMTFAAPARVMKVVMIHANEQGEQEARVEIPTRDKITEIELTPEFMGAGLYTIQWRALSDDGHALNGEWNFQVAE